MAKQLPLPLPLPPAQRWRNGYDSYRRPGEEIPTRDYAVERITSTIAGRLIAEHHYLRTMPYTIASWGLFYTPGLAPAQLVGTLVLGVPINRKAAEKLIGPDRATADISRLLLVDSVPYNGESWFTAQVFRQIATDPELRSLELITSYSDPTVRMTTTGHIVKRGHLGGVYQTLSAIYTGRTRRAKVYVATKTGDILNSRSLSKIANEREGIDAAIKRLVTMGAPARLTHETGRAYLTRALTEGPFHKAVHPGNHRYFFPQTRHARRALEPYDLTPALYPKAAYAPGPTIFTVPGAADLDVFDAPDESELLLAGEHPPLAA